MVYVELVGFRDGEDAKERGNEELNSCQFYFNNKGAIMFIIKKWKIVKGVGLDVGNLVIQILQNFDIEIDEVRIRDINLGIN